jgi:hypothetical protein
MRIARRQPHGPRTLSTPSPAICNLSSSRQQSLYSVPMNDFLRMHSSTPFARPDLPCHHIMLLTSKKGPAAPAATSAIHTYPGFDSRSSNLLTRSNHLRLPSHSVLCPDHYFATCLISFSRIPFIPACILPWSYLLLLSFSLTLTILITHNSGNLRTTRPCL